MIWVQHLGGADLRKPLHLEPNQVGVRCLDEMVSCVVYTPE